MEQIRVFNSLVVTLMCLVCFGISSVAMCSDSDALIETYVSSSNDDLVDSAKLKVIPITESGWESHVMESELPVVVMFTADWCGPCRLMLPKLIQLEQEFTGRFNFYTLDTNKEGNIALRYGIRSLPTTIVFKGGEEMGIVAGANPGMIRELLDRYA